MARPFDDFMDHLGSVAAGLPDRRTGDNCVFSMGDFTCSAFSVFFSQCPSFLSYQMAMEQARGCNNARSLFRVGRIPSDNQVRQMLDPVDPGLFFELFDDLFAAFEETGVLSAMRAVHNTRLIALDGTWYFSSQNIHCEQCSRIEHEGGQVTCFHSAITPVVVSPGHSKVVPLRPEFITPQDGHTKQDCEIAAAKRWLAAHGERYSRGGATLLGDDLYAHQPFCRQALLHNFHFLFTCKPKSHPHLSKWVEALEEGRDRHTLKLRVKGKASRWEHHHYQWANGVPMTEEEGALKVNWFQLEITSEEGKKLYRNSYITDWAINADTVAALVAAGRARWKIENENNNVLKNRGYHLEHNFGHGKKHLAHVLVTLNLLAFGLHTLLELADENYRLIRATVGARRRFFQHLEALTSYWHFESWEKLMDFMMRGLEIGPYTVKKS